MLAGSMQPGARCDRREEAGYRSTRRLQGTWVDGLETGREGGLLCWYGFGGWFAFGVFLMEVPLLFLSIRRRE